MEQKLDERGRELEMLAALARAVATTRSFTTLFVQALQQIEAHFAFDRLVAGIYHPRTDRLTLFTAAPGTTVTEGTTIPLPVPLRPLLEEQHALSFSDLEAVEAALPERTASGFSAGMAVPLRHAGQVFGLLAMLRREPDEYGEKAHSLFQEVADQIAPALASARLRQQLQHNREHYRTLFDQANDPIFILDLATAKVVDVNTRACQHLGYSREELIGMSLAAFDVATARSEQATILQELQERRQLVFERVHRRKDGTLVPVEISSRLIDHGGGSIVQSFVRDITERKQREAQLRFQARLLDMVEQSVIVTDPEGTITYWNRFAEKLFGWSAAEARGHTVYEMTLPLMSRRQAEEVMERLRAGESWSGEIVLGRRDGTTFPALVTDTPVRDENGEVSAIIGLSQDIAERKALQRAAATVSSTLDLDRVLDLILSELGRVLFYDSAAIFLVDGNEAEIVAARNLPQEAVGHRFSVRADPFLQEMNRSGQPIILDDARTHPAFKGWSGTEQVRGWLAVPLISPAGLTGYLTLDSNQPSTYDHTAAGLALSFAQHAAMAVENARLHEDLRAYLADLEAAQTRLIQSEKLATIGELVAGVAHELNNPLAAILLYAQLLQQRTGEENGHKELDRIEEQTLRARDIVESLLDFARQRTPRYEPVQVNDVLESGLSLLIYRLQSHDIAVSRDLAPDLPPIEADPGQLQQVFVNILNNAYQAIRDSDQGGRLSLRTRKSVSRFLPTREATSPQVIRITLHNDGPPIPPETLSSIFDPFFTTKEPGAGTGLGLAVSYGIIQEHGGNIWAESGPDAGTTFFVELPFLPPATAPAHEEAQAESRSEPALTAVAKGRALVIDDEPSMRFGLQEALDTLGFSADSAADGRAGLARLEQTAYELLLCDIRMPGLDGIAFYEQLQRLHPALLNRIIFITGDAISTETRRFLQENRLPYLVKPFAIDTLLEKVREVVGE